MMELLQPSLEVHHSNAQKLHLFFLQIQMHGIQKDFVLNTVKHVAKALPLDRQLQQWNPPSWAEYTPVLIGWFLLSVME